MVLRDIDELRSLLETTPRKHVSTPLTEGAGLSRNGDAVKGYSFALNSAERSVDRLGKAIEAAEEEMESALKRTTDVHKSQLKQKDLEIYELQRVLTTKDKSIESLRDALTNTKKTYETKLAQSEAALALKDVELKATQEELRSLRVERDSLENQLQKETTQHQRVCHEYQERERTLANTVRSHEESTGQTYVALQQERQDKGELQRQNAALTAELETCKQELFQFQQELTRARMDSDKYRQEMSSLQQDYKTVKQKLKVEREVSKTLQQQNEVEKAERNVVEGAKHLLEKEVEELHGLRKQLRVERSIRRACEKWLRAELKSREEMDTLLAAVKEVSAGNAPTDSEFLEVEQLIEKMKIATPCNIDTYNPRASTNNPSYSLDFFPPSSASNEFTALKAALEEDNQRLKAELAATRRMLSEKLSSQKPKRM